MFAIQIKKSVMLKNDIILMFFGKEGSVCERERVREPGDLITSIFVEVLIFGPLNFLYSEFHS